MLNDHDDKYEGHEESEYHFSDEEVNYEVEAEAPKKAPSESGEKKENLIARLSQSKRMLIVGGVFLVLVFAVYKIVSPSSSIPATDISAAPVMAQNTSSMPQAATNPQSAPQAATAASTPAVTPVAQAVPAPAAAPVQTPAPQVAMAPAAQPVANAAMPQANGMTPPAAAQPAPGNQQQVAQMPAMTQPAMPQQPAMAQQPAPTGIANATMPAVIPVTAPTPAPTPDNSYNPGQMANGSTGNMIDESSAVLAANSEKLAAQADAKASQQYNDYMNQNKALQAQVETLSSRMGVMENQLNQLVQALTRRNQGSTMANPGAAPTQSQSIAQGSANALPQAAETKIAYNVQAIIPGRAWLKAENGETLTVAEGDMIKDLGRVTKIDPYDGVVEINTGAKSVSLSYGNGG